MNDTVKVDIIGMLKRMSDLTVNGDPYVNIKDVEFVLKTLGIIPKEQSQK